jgi:3-isopropylmalate/(R)-2-methylmalate dehydratase small subunit
MIEMTERKLVFKGRAWVLRSTEGALFSDIDTDMIFHNAHLHITDISKMGAYAFGNLKGYENFASEAKTGDIVIAGENFGSGSSRQQAVDCFPSLGVSCLVTTSYGAIYKRNAINSGFPICTIESINTTDKEKPGYVEHMDVIEVDVGTREIRKDGKKIGTIRQWSNVQMDIYKAGNIFEYAKRI